MSPEDRTARRYHWLSDKTTDFVVEPHNAIVGDAKREKALDMTARRSESARKASLDLVKEPTRKLSRLFEDARPLSQRSLKEWIPQTRAEQPFAVLTMPRGINWNTMRRVYEFQPRNYEEFLSIKGVGPATVRGLALVAELVYGEKPSWEDPVKYSFAYGGKDGVPFPVNRRAMDESISVLRETWRNAKIDDGERARSLQRLRQFVQENAKL